MVNSVRISTLIGVIRAGIGVGYMIAPTRAHMTLAGRDASLPTTRAASRTFGIREIYVDGRVVAAQAWAPRAAVPLLIAGVVIDAWDTAAFAMTADLTHGMRRTAAQSLAYSPSAESPRRYRLHAPAEASNSLNLSCENGC